MDVIPIHSQVTQAPRKSQPPSSYKFPEVLHLKPDNFRHYQHQQFAMRFAAILFLPLIAATALPSA